MSFYRARVQMALIVHNEQAAVIETEIELPDYYTPITGTWLSHAYWNGPSPIRHVGYDAKVGRHIITLHATATDASCNLEEWLEQHPHWYIPDYSTIDIQRKNEQTGQYEDQPLPGIDDQEDDEP